MKTRIEQLRGRAGRAGFTLIEMLVAVGAVALVGVAIAAVFEAVGKTVTTGKRVGAMNSYANLIKRQLEQDFAAMTREGFLVIRNEMAGLPPGPLGAQVPTPIPLYADQRADDPSIRPRRIDEIMFFAKGDFTTAREAIDPRFIAKGDAARIYYGIGMRRRPDFSSNSGYAYPRLDDINQENNSWIGEQAAGNPNRYASEWTLLRHVTVLAPVQSSLQWPSNFSIPAYGISSGEWPDQDTQVALQPAASNLFRSLSLIFPVASAGAPTAQPIRAGYPLIASGLVDVATTTLSEVRAIVTTADTWPGQVPSGYSGSSADADFFDPTQNNGADGTNEGLDGKYRLYGTGSTEDDEVMGRMQAWMDDAFPGFVGSGPNQRTRIRYEPEPPNYMGITGDPNLTAFQAAAFRADQLMLSSSNFVPRCTEFIVEWSFGRTYPSVTGSNYWAGHEGELIWHGMERLADGTPVKDDEESVARPYSPLYPSNPVWKPRAATVWPNYLTIAGAVDKGANTLTDLIHGQGFNPANLQEGQTLTSFFGYMDPTFNPDRDGDGHVQSADDSATTTVPWPWPKLVRITIGLADPADPTIEQRFQFVFELPDDDGL